MKVEEIQTIHEGDQTWAERHEDKQSFADRLADKIAATMGSWGFIIVQTALVLIWMVVNILVVTLQWDPYPFILLNLLFSTQAAYAAPIIMMSQNRQSQRDRFQAEQDYVTNIKAKEEIESVLVTLGRLESEKLDAILARLPKRPLTRRR
jgi:uncharacterized membrane protein